MYKKITVSLPKDLIEYLDQVSPTNRSREILVAIELRRMLRHVATVSSLECQINESIPADSRGRPNRFKALLAERDRIAREATNREIEKHQRHETAIKHSK